MQRALIISDETGNTGDASWGNQQQFFVQGALVIKDIEVGDLIRLTKAVRKRLSLPHLHMAEYRINEKRRIADEVLRALGKLDWTWIEFAIERKFYPATYLADLAFCELNYDGKPFRAHNVYKNLVDLLSNIHFPMSVKQSIWSAFMNEDASALDSALVDLYGVCCESQSAFCGEVSFRIEDLLRKGQASTAELILQNAAYRPAFNNYQFKAFVQTMLQCQNLMPANVKIDVVVEHELQIERKLQLAQELNYRVPFADVIRLERDKTVCEFADVLLWLSRGYHKFHTEAVQELRAVDAMPEELRERIVPIIGNFLTAGISRYHAIRSMRQELPHSTVDPLFSALFREYCGHHHLINQHVDAEPVCL